MISGIKDRRIGNPEDINPTHFSFMKSEFSIRERTVVLWTIRSHAERS
jgi:hypothetical protein